MDIHATDTAVCNIQDGVCVFFSVFVTLLYSHDVLVVASAKSSPSAFGVGLDR